MEHDSVRDCVLGCVCMLVWRGSVAAKCMVGHEMNVGESSQPARMHAIEPAHLKMRAKHLCWEFTCRIIYLTYTSTHRGHVLLAHSFGDLGRRAAHRLPAAG